MSGLRSPFDGDRSGVNHHLQTHAQDRQRKFPYTGLLLFSSLLMAPALHRFISWEDQSGFRENLMSKRKKS